MTQAESAEQSTAGNGAPPRDDRPKNVAKTLLWIGVAGVSAALAFTVVRLLAGRAPVDPTSQRIQHLIDEANSLLKTLDDKKLSG